MASKRKTTAEAPEPAETVTSIKGFDRNWQCRGFQFAIGQTYIHEGSVKACNSGFHAIEGYPLEVLDYYPPGMSRYAEVTQSGALSRHSGDSKLASAKITIGVELHLHELVQRTVKWVIDHCTPADAKHAEGYRSAASSTGYQSAASSTGDRSAASSTGYQSAASSTGDQSAASSTGDRSAAMSSGLGGRAMAAEGCALFLVYRDPESYDIKHAWAGIAGRNGIEPLVWYQLGADGKPFALAGAGA